MEEGKRERGGGVCLLQLLAFFLDLMGITSKLAMGPWVWGLEYDV
jgi:hypothetical protein